MAGASRQAVLFLVVALTLLWAGVGYFAWLERERAIKAAEDDVSVLAIAFEEQAYWLLSSVERVLRAAKQDYEADPSGFDIKKILRLHGLPDDMRLQMSVIGHDGYLVSSSLGLGPDARITNYLDRAHVSAHVGEDTGKIFIGPPIIGRISSMWSLPITIRLNKADGSFAGVAAAVVDPLYLSSMHKRLDLGRDGVVTLLGMDGIIRARSHMVTGATEQTGLGTVLTNSISVKRAEEAQSGVDISVSRVDAIQRIVSFRRVRSYPLVVLVGRSLDQVLIPWKEQVLRNALVAALLSLAMFGIFRMMVRETKRRQAQARNLSEANRLLRLAEQVSMIGHWRVEIAAGKVTWSDEVYRIHGLTKGQFVPTVESALNAYHPDDREKIRQAIATATASGTAFEQNLRIIRPGGEIRHVVTRGLVEQGADGKPAALFGAISDVTNRTQQEEALLQAQRDAEQAVRAKSDFLATVSHELRTPLNAVIGFADLLLTADPPEAERRRYIRLQAEAGRTLLAVINDVLDFSKIDGGHLQLDPIPSDTIGLLQTCVELVRPMAQEKGLNLRVDLAPDLPAWLLLDSNRVRQIVLNLLNNATKFTQAGMVLLTARALRDGPQGDMLRISVQDTGIGIAPDRQARLFEPFHQADNSTARRYGGTGLGLAICKRLVGLMDGRIGVSSEPGRGSLFWVEIPMLVTSPPENAPALPLPRDGEAAPPRPLHVLVAEDLPVNQLLVRAILERAGHKVNTALDGQAALNAVQRQEFDLVLMDVQMPGMDGLEATRAIRALPTASGRIPIIALTANALASEVERCRDAGMNDHIAKPIDAEHLIATLARWSQRIGPREVPVAPGAPPAPPAPKALDVATLAQLEILMGRGTLLTMLAEVETTLRGRMSQILAPAMDVGTVRAQAHAMVSLAGNFGLMEMSAEARNLEQGIDQNLDHKAALAALDAAANRAFVALKEWQATALADAPVA